MHKNVEKLMDMLHPPASPMYNNGDWALVESEVGQVLPSDFKDFTEAYGAVGICGYLWLHAPFYFVGDGAYIPFLEEKDDFLPLLMSQLKQMDAVVDGRANVPYPNFPTPGGLLPIGTTGNGDIICWITDGPPEEWGTFFWAFPGVNTFAFPHLNITGFLLELLTLESPLFSSFLSTDPFEPANRKIDIVS